MGHIYNAVVIGAGLSGLACAFRLQQLGIRALVLEASGQAGGMVSTVRRNGFVFEGGPQCPRFPASVWTLVRELKLESEFVAGDPKAKRYILREGRLHLAPFSPGGLLGTNLVSGRSKYRLLTEALRNSHPPAKEESLAEFVERKFGGEVLDYLVDPFASTVFFSDAHKMGMESAFPALVEWERSRGSVVRGAIHALKSRRGNARPSAIGTSPATSNARHGGLYVTDALPSLGTFKQGMGFLIEGLAERLRENIRFETEVESVIAGEGGNSGTNTGWSIRVSGGEEFAAKAVVVALPACATAPLLERSAPKLGAMLAAIEYASISVVSSAYERKQVLHSLDGFGFMIPRREGFDTFCTFWNSSLFPDKAPRGTVLMTSFAAGNDGDLMKAPEDRIAQTVEAENAKILGISGTPVERIVWKYPRALPQYTVGHANRVKEVQEAIGELSGLYLAGNYLTGRSLGDCADTGFQAAEKVHSYLQG